MVQPVPLNNAAPAGWTINPETIASGLESIPSSRFGILGVETSLQTDSPALLEFFRHAYRWFPSTGGEPDLNLVAVFSDKPAGRPFALAGEQCLDLSDSSSPENRAFLFLLESIMDRIEASIVVHAGAVHFQKTGVMVAGSAFAGKSTLVIELMKLGAGFLSDDAAPLDRASGLLLPYPRAIGVRKKAGFELGEPEKAFSPKALELPHRWLVDPRSYGAELPASACEAGFLFYLDPGVARSSHESRRFEVALAEMSDHIQVELETLSPGKIEKVEGRVFPTVSLRFPGDSRPGSALMNLWRRNRGEILYVEEIRPEPSRSSGKPRIERTQVGAILVELVRDVLNRGDKGRLLSAHEGRLTSLAMELGALLKDTRCYRVTGGTPAAVARALADEVRQQRQPA